MTMPSVVAAIMNKNYSHCPLKKRPVQIFETISDEPENLSTKPEDLRITERRTSVSPSSSSSSESAPTSPQFSESSTPPLASPPMSPASSSSPPFFIYQPTAVKQEARLPPYPSTTPLIKSERLGYPAINPEYAPQTWHRSVAPIYPPSYGFMPYAAAYHNHNLHHQDYNNIGANSPQHDSDDSSLSPPHHQINLHHHHHHHQQPLAPLALRPSTVYSSIDQSSLSPNSSTTSPPPSSTIIAEDLSEKRRQGVRHQCPDCGKSYSTFSGLSKHRQFHCAAGDGPKKSFSCKYCEKVYFSLGALKMHIRTHTLPCKCTICGKAFSRPWLLQGHIRTHTGEKPFSCTYCNRAFADRSNLRAHLQTHSDVKKYSCPSCSKTFSRMSLLTKHAEGGCNGVPPSILHQEKMY